MFTQLNPKNQKEWLHKRLVFENGEPDEADIAETQSADFAESTEVGDEKAPVLVKAKVQTRETIDAIFIAKIGQEMYELFSEHGLIPAVFDERAVNNLNDQVARLEFLQVITGIKPKELLERIKIAKERGEWPPYIGYDSILKRIPIEEEENAPGFDAGLAFVMKLVPDEVSGITCKLHAAYTPTAVAQVRAETEDLDPNSETCWWLAACSVCQEGEINRSKFKAQIEKFKHLASDPEARKKAAQGSLDEKMSTFESPETYGFPYGKIDGCIQGAYIAGYPYGVNWSENYGIFFVGTYEASLGLEEYDWGKFDSTYDASNPMSNSGPVFGSRQFIKCANERQLLDALKIVKKNLDDKGKKKIETPLKEFDFLAARGKVEN